MKTEKLVEGLDKILMALRETDVFRDNIKYYADIIAECITIVQDHEKLLKYKKSEVGSRR